jgi:hypothetical protein
MNFNEYQKITGLRTKDIADILGVSLNTVYNLQQGKAIKPFVAEKIIKVTSGFDGDARIKKEDLNIS